MKNFKSLHSTDKMSHRRRVFAYMPRAVRRGLLEQNTKFVQPCELLEEERDHPALVSALAKMGTLAKECTSCTCPHFQSKQTIFRDDTMDSCPSSQFQRAIDEVAILEEIFKPCDPVYLPSTLRGSRGSKPVSSSWKHLPTRHREYTRIRGKKQRGNKSRRWIRDSLVLG